MYLQLEDALRQRIESGELKPGSALPSEHQLETFYQVSRVTVREAISRLVGAGYARKERGKGTFVLRARKIDELIGRVTSFTEEIRARGLTPETKTLSSGIQVPPARIRDMLQLDPTDRVFGLERLRLVDGDIVGLSRDFVPARLVPNLTEKDHSQESFYQLLERDYRFEMVEAQEEVEAALPTQLDARLLEVNHVSPVLVVHRVVYGRAGDVDWTGPVEALVTVFRGDRFRYCAWLAGRK